MRLQLLGATVSSSCKTIQFRYTGISSLMRKRAFLSRPNVRSFSSKNDTKDASLPYPSIYIRYASQGGTAQLFAQQLYEALDEAVTPPVVDPTLPSSIPELHLQAWNDVPPEEFFESKQALYLLLTSTAGIGQPPENGRVFYEWLMQQPAPELTINDSEPVEFALFGLGNQLAHPNHYNSCAKDVYEKLTSLGNSYRPVLPLTLGDDGGCIDDDFDQWQEAVIDFVTSNKKNDNHAIEEQDTTLTDESDSISSSSSSTVASSSKDIHADLLPMIVCSGAKSSSGHRLSSSNVKKYPTLRLEKGTTQVVRGDLLDVAPSFYPPDTHRMTVLSQTSLNTMDPTASSLHELRFRFPESANLEYEAGDHVVIMPRNAEYIVQAVVDLLDVHPHAVIQGPIDHSVSGQYPFPTGLSVLETLSHCVDLTTTPSPAFCRFLLNSDNRTMDYKSDIALPHRTVLDLLLERRATLPPDHPLISLEDLLYNLPPMQGRYYSIASSSLVHPGTIFLTFRPLQYVTSRGNRLQGVCTSFMSGLTSGSQVLASVHANPTFRLPSDPAIPVILMAGGCGVAPIRAFLEDRLSNASETKNVCAGMHLFLGFRNPADQVYGELVQKAVQAGAVAHVTFSTGCSNNQCGQVTDAVRKHAQTVYDLLQPQDGRHGAHIYLCGGARTFGVAVENELHALYQKYGRCTDEEASEAMRQLAKEGRLHEDLAD